MTGRPRQTARHKARPFLKWAGGKRQLLPQISVFLPDQLKDGHIRRYVEPFVGSGAVFFHLVQTYTIPELYISDLNPELIRAYRTVQRDVENLIAFLQEIEAAYLPLAEQERKRFYYAQRERFNVTRPSAASSSPAEACPQRTAQLIFLNRTCYNGLFRVNAAGEFNVPFGRYRRPRICDEPNLRAVSAILQHTEIHYGRYSDCADFVDDATFVYFDPPYRPLTSTANFTAYSQHSFDDAAQLELAAFYRRLDAVGAALLLSNSDPRNVDPADDFFEAAYAGFRFERVRASRRINSRAEKRGPINELLIANY
jgi:DNA adenine methylase